MGQWKKVPEALAERFAASLPKSAQVERRKMFGCPCAFVNGNMFAGIHEERLIVRLSQEGRVKLAREAGAVPFTVMGRTMREYLAVEDALARPAEDLAAWIQLAFDHTRALPPKASKGRTPRRGSSTSAAS